MGKNAGLFYYYLMMLVGARPYRLVTALGKDDPPYLRKHLEEAEVAFLAPRALLKELCLRNGRMVSSKTETNVLL